MAHMPVLPPQQPPQQPQRNFSPYHTSPSTGLTSPGGIALPPAKRPRLSPNPPSPYSSPAYGAPTNGYMPMQTPSPQALHLPFNQPQPLPQNLNNDIGMRGAPGSMGPPQRPVEKSDKADRSTDINDLSDLITASGIDLREEENYLAATYRNQHQNTSFSTSFNTNGSSTISPENSFNWSQNIGGHAAFQGNGPLSQPPVTPVKVQDEVTEKHRQAARALSVQHQKHLNDSFLTPNCVRNRLHRRTYENGIQLNVNGLYDRVVEKPMTVHGTIARGSTNEDPALLQMSSNSLLEHDAPLVDILTLVSLATQERLRNLLEDAFALSRGRQSTSHGTVPPEWSSIAVGNGNPQSLTAISTALTKSAWEPENAISPMVPIKINTSFEDSKSARLPTPPTDTPPTPLPTISFPNEIAPALKKVSVRDRQFEEARIAARNKRLRASQQSADTPTAPGTPILGDRAPEIKMTKKERDRLAKAGQTDDMLHQNTNKTASLALGGGGRKYAWMTAASGGGSGASTPSRINTSVGVSSSSAAPTTDRALMARDRTYGSWREDGPRGKGISVKDLIGALEYDGREVKTLVSALARLKSTD